MNGCQRIRAALRGESADRTPVMLHNFLMAAREAGVPMREFRRDPRAVARCFILAVETYGYDGVVLDIDTATLAAAVGCRIEEPDDLPARCIGPAIGSLEECAGREPPRLREHPAVQVWLEAAALLRRHFGDEVMVRGNCDQAPYSLAALMRSPELWMTDLLDESRHESAHRLLEFATAVTSEFIRLMAASGAHMVSNGDSLAGTELISPRLYRAFALPYERRVAAVASECGMPYFLHICGKTDAILRDMVETGADGLELDHKTSLAAARDALGERTVFIGNIDPSEVLARGSRELVERKMRELLAAFAGSPRLIVNAGCAIPASTPSENIHALVRAAPRGAAGTADRKES